MTKRQVANSKKTAKRKDQAAASAEYLSRACAPVVLLSLDVARTTGAAIMYPAAALDSASVQVAKAIEIDVYKDMAAIEALYYDAIQCARDQGMPLYAVYETWGAGGLSPVTWVGMGKSLYPWEYLWPRVIKAAKATYGKEVRKLLSIGNELKQDAREWQNAVLLETHALDEKAGKLRRMDSDGLKAQSIAFCGQLHPGLAVGTNSADAVCMGHYVMRSEKLHKLVSKKGKQDE